jgi:hypothetical protein
VDGLLHPTPATAFDVLSGIASALVFLAVGFGAYVHRTRDARSRVFLAIAVASLAPYLLPATLGRLGLGTLFGAATAATAVSLAVGSVALFHFTQVFPARRPWIRAHGLWLLAAYAGLPLVALACAWALLPIFRFLADVASPDPTRLTWEGMGPLGSLVLVVVLLPTVFVAGIVLPFGALLSLYRSWQEAKANGRDGARVITVTILISQLAGGVLTILVVPLLHSVAPAGPWVTIASGLLFGFGLLMPLAFAIGVWRYQLLSWE